MANPPEMGGGRMFGHETGRRRRKSVPGPDSLKRWFERSGLPLKEHQYLQLWRYHRLIRKRNAELDLTRIYQFDNMVQKHYIVCVLVAKLMKWKIPSPLLDIGTGAGLPGIPLKIACPGNEIILSEGRPKRVRFLSEVVQALDLKGVEVLGEKIHSSFDRRVNGVITRALETIPKTLLRISGCLVRKGWAIFMKGPHCDEELEAALENYEDYRLIQNVPYTIPHSPHQRRLVILQRLSEPGTRSQRSEDTPT
jgi:16S rRNA (guanine(527)-N(7))-methyltransferase RsmG